MDKWNEFRTAYQLAKLKTLSATANELGVHRSTVMRHIDTLEDSLQVKLFQRNDRGYIPTETGLELMRLGEVTDNHFSQFAARSKNHTQEIEGTLSITCVSELSQVMMPSIIEYQSRFPKMKIDILGDVRKFNLEYGEADIAVRVGEKPTTLDNVVIPLMEMEVCFAVHQTYIERYGLPVSENLTEHRFLALKERLSQLPWNEWIYDNIADQNIVITASEHRILNYALFNGCGISFVAKEMINQHAELTEIKLDQHWKVPVWLLVHRDMFNMPKIREFVDILRKQQHWPLEFLR